jgi:hypothetical protein
MLMERFTPAFLQKIDKDWLLNQPEIWATRIHYLLFWATIYTLVVSLLGFLYPISTHNVPDPEVFTLITLIPAGIIFLYWAYQLSLYKVSEQFGNITRSFSFKELFIYGSGILLLSIGGFVVGKIFSDKNASLVSQSALVTDVNNMNKGYIFIQTGKAHLIDFYLYHSNEDNANVDNEIAPFYLYSGYVTSENLLVNYEVKEALIPSKKSEKMQMELIENFLHSYNRYASVPLNISAKEVLNGFKQRLEEAKRGQLDLDTNNDWGLDQEIRKINTAITTIVRSKNHQTAFYEWEAYSAYTIFLSFLGLALLIFLRVGLRDFLITFLAGGVLMLASALLLAFVRADVHGASILFFIEWIGGFILIKMLKQTVLMQLVKRVSWALLIITTPFFPLACLYLFSTNVHDREGFIVMTVGCVIAAFAWLRSYNQQLLKVHSEPKIN